jgi:hydrophobe/amphiphile efflux-1 (HAE1) family protein
MIFSLSTNFIKRPVLTTVCTIIILLVGGIAIPILPIASLPQIAPTTINVTSTYIGADAKTTSDTVTTPIERQINGVEDMQFISSNTTNSGVSSIAVSFPPYVDRSIAQVNVQNRAGQAESSLPSIVTDRGVVTEASSPSILLIYSFYSDKDQQGNVLYDPIFMSNYLDLFIFDEISRLPGVGSVSILGERKYAMRFWLDPDKLAARALTAGDVIAAIQEQNIQVGAGRIGSQPSPEDQQFEIALRAIGRFANEAEAENLVVQVGSDGTLIRIKDIGRVELGAENYNFTAEFNGEPTVALAIYQLPGSNALETANLIKEKVFELQQAFPPGLKYDLAFDTTLFVEVSLRETVLALIQAILLVVLIIFVFLQDWRTTIIPAIAIPVALIGAMAGLLAFGFELNQLTLFACVLATGLVVDDGIVVVEAISQKIDDGMRPLQASLDAMDELVGAVISTSVVLMAVFIPVAFFPGTTGIVYRQFAITIAFAILFSTFNALSFSPAMASLLLRPKQEAHGPLGLFFNWFNIAFEWFTQRYRQFVEFLTHIKTLVMGIFIAGLVATVLMYQAVPSGFIPEEDQGFFFVIGSAPAGVSLNYTNEQVKAISNILDDFPELESKFGISGFGFDGAGTNQLVFFVNLKPWDDRPGEVKSVFGIVQRVNQRLARLSTVRAFAVNAPPVQGLSSTGGFEFMLQNIAGLPMEELINVSQRLLMEANNREKYPELGRVFTQFTTNTPQIAISIDRNKAKALDLDITSVFSTIQTYLGSRYVNDFVLGERQYGVFVQAEGGFRSNPQDIGRFYIRSRNGSLVQLNNVVQLEEFTYPPIITHYNIYSAIKIQGSPAPGFSSGQAIVAMERAAAEVLPQGFGYEWTGTAAEEKSGAGAAPIIFGLGFTMVFLVLAAQYESYVDPAIIMLTVPLAVLGAISGIWFRANIFQTDGIWPLVNNNTYCQVGLIMLIGMASKNTILIVEFANQSRALGMSITRAAVYAAEKRFRPILMTAISSLVGFWPLVIAAGAGAMSRWTLGTAVFGGMLVSTVLSLVIAPILYIVIKSFEQSVLLGGGGGSGKSSGTQHSPQPQLSGDEEVEVIVNFEPSSQNE